MDSEADSATNFTDPEIFAEELQVVLRCPDRLLFPEVKVHHPVEDPRFPITVFPGAVAPVPPEHRRYQEPAQVQARETGLQALLSQEECTTGTTESRIRPCQEVRLCRRVANRQRRAPPQGDLTTSVLAEPATVVLLLLVKVVVFKGTLVLFLLLQEVVLLPEVCKATVSRKGKERLKI